jgi:hypothetical protein
MAQLAQQMWKRIFNRWNLKFKVKILKSLPSPKRLRAGRQMSNEFKAPNSVIQPFRVDHNQG